MTALALVFSILPGRLTAAPAQALPGVSTLVYYEGFDACTLYSTTSMNTWCNDSPYWVRGFYQVNGQSLSGKTSC